MYRNEIFQLFANDLICNPIHIHLEDREYTVYKKSIVKELLYDFKGKPYVPEYHDCDDQADDMRYYLRKNGVKTGYLKIKNHMMLIFCTTNKELLTIDPGTKRIAPIPNGVEYVAWW